MNFLAHAIANLDRPYVVAGTAVPDMLNVVDRRMKVRSKAARSWLHEQDFRVRDVASGIIRHHEDDLWFHATRAFTELNLQFAIELREILVGDAGFRPSFVGHISVEMLIDANLMDDNPYLADRYYRSLASLDPQVVQEAVNKIANKTTEKLVTLIPHFVTEGFLYDYRSDEGMLFRLNQIMKRVGLPQLPPTTVGWLQSARLQVKKRCDELLTPPSSP